MPRLLAAFGILYYSIFPITKNIYFSFDVTHFQISDIFLNKKSFSFYIYANYHIKVNDFFKNFSPKCAFFFCVATVTA